MQTPNSNQGQQTAAQTQPSAADSKTKMANPPVNTVKMVKIKALRQFRLDEAGAEKKRRDRIVKPDEVIEVSEEQAKMICRPRKTYYDHEGEKSNVKGPTYEIYAEIVRD